MPRASSSTSMRPTAALGSSHPSVLKRNKACHQCRRRKLKCDAKRPCSTCVRSHAHALSHAPSGTSLPSAPECTFDDVADATAPATAGPKNRYERLENRISELEALLRQKEKGASVAPESSLDSGNTPPGQSLADVDPSFNESSFSSRYRLTSPSDGSQLQQQYPSRATYFDSTVNTTSTPTSFPLPPANLDLVWLNWPQDIPPPDLLRHLVDVFFVFHPHANRLFHLPTFIHTLNLPPSHPKFPSPPVLHAICAIGSLYTAAVTSPPLPNFDEVPSDEIFLERLRAKEQRPDSFAEQQAKLARETAEKLNSLGEDLFQVLQANVILTWFYWSHGRWVDLFLTSSHCLRLSLPLGLNMCPPFHSITKSERPQSILPLARTVVEDETRRNAFWLAYATERQFGFGNCWAISLDDQDVSQLLPVRGDQFNQGTLVAPMERQWAHTRNLLLVHADKQTDSFLLYIKGTIMLSHVKTFNMRFRSRHFAGDSAVTSPYNDVVQSSDPSDPRGSQAFIELDHVVSSFKESFPTHLRNPIVGNVVDNHLYTTCLMSHVATIILHDPHAEVCRSGCISALKILTAARAILDHIYAVWSTSFDISLLDTFCSLCWFLSGRVLLRFLEAALDARSLDQISTIRAEINFIHSAIAKVGQRVPLAHRYAKMLEDLIIKRCGPASGYSAQINFPRSLHLDDLHTLFEENNDPSQ